MAEPARADSRQSTVAGADPQALLRHPVATTPRLKMKRASNNRGLGFLPLTRLTRQAASFVKTGIEDLRNPIDSS